MFFKKKKNKLSPISYYIYEESRIGTEKLYSTIKETNSWEIKNQTTFVITSLIYHFFFYRMILISKYDDSFIQPILTECLYEMISHITNKIEEKNALIELSDEIFTNLDNIVRNRNNCQNKDEIVELMQLEAKYFIANVDGIKPKDVYNVLAVLTINMYFTSLLDDGKDFLFHIDNL